MIEIKDLVYEYPTRRALNGLSLEIEKGGITALTGPNGAGKTTLISCLVGLQIPLNGSVKINGLDVIENPEVVSESIGYLPDIFGLYENLTVRQCLAYAALSHNVVDVDEKVEIAASRVNMIDRLDEKCSQLSRGLRQRVAIGQAIIHQPDFLILDEPASGLDPDARIKLSMLFRQLRKEGMTLIVSSHILSELDDYATDLIVIRNGKLIAHKKVSTEDYNSRIRKLKIRLLEEDKNVEKILNKNKAVKELKVNENLVSVIFEGNLEVQKKILADIVAKDISVVEYYLDEEWLQDSYMAAVEEEEK